MEETLISPTAGSSPTRCSDLGTLPALARTLTSLFEQALAITAVRSARKLAYYRYQLSHRGNFDRLQRRRRSA